jgi:hypothetical protein
MQSETSLASPATLHLESRIREPMFRRFEPLLAEAVRNFPADTEFTRPKDIAISTFAARFRDSIISLSRFKWHIHGKLGPNPDGSGTLIDLKKLQTMEGPPKVYMIQPSVNGESLWFRQKTTAGRMPALNFNHRTAADNVLPTPWQDTTVEELTALCTLLHSRRLQGPFLLHCQLSDSTIMSLQSRYDIALVWDEKQGCMVVT